jgi:hypothetical protein
MAGRIDAAGVVRRRLVRERRRRAHSRCRADRERCSVTFLMPGENVPRARPHVSRPDMPTRMTSHLHALCFDARDPLRLARFWAGVPGWESAADSSADSADGIVLLPRDDTGFRIRFLPTRERRTGPNQMHFDLTSTSPDDQRQVVARSLSPGARHIDVGRRPEEGHVVLADPNTSHYRFYRESRSVNVPDQLAKVRVQGRLTPDELHVQGPQVGQFVDDALPVVHGHGAVGAFGGRVCVAVVTELVAQSRDL